MSTALSCKALKLWLPSENGTHHGRASPTPYPLHPSHLPLTPAASGLHSSPSPGPSRPQRNTKHTTEVTDWNSQCEQFQSFACCFWPPGSRACCGGRVWLADVSLCSYTAEVFWRGPQRWASSDCLVTACQRWAGLPLTHGSSIRAHQHWSAAQIVFLDRKF